MRDNDLIKEILTACGVILVLVAVFAVFGALAP
jgi:hypothetical protein